MEVLEQRLPVKNKKIKNIPTKIWRIKNVFISKQFYTGFKNVKLNIIPIFLLFIVSCASVEFIPDSDFKETNSNYDKKKWDEVEIHVSRPPGSLEFVGTVHLRNFESGNSLEYLPMVKKELFEKKIDGVIFYRKTIEDAPPIVYSIRNQDGMPVSYYESDNEIRRITGQAFRYRRK